MAATPLLNDPDRAWATYTPSTQSPWDLPRAAHLHRRAGFAAPWGVLARDVNDGPEASVDRLLDGDVVSADGQPAAEAESLFDSMALQLSSEAGLARLQAIWLYRMIFTPHPLRERMTLFWHNHFATSFTKVKNPSLMQRQNALFRTHALGDFKALLAAVGRDPAMLIWLDSTENRKAHPNENYAREVMELFTLGRGHYTEKDVQETARAFTGWCVRLDRFCDVASQHDSGSKTVLGHSGPLRGDDIPLILLEQPACAEFLCRKLIRHFVTEVDPISADLVAPLAVDFRRSGYDVRVPVRTILRSNLFHDPAMRGRRVKSPVELTVGTIRALEAVRPTVGVEALADACQQMGQALYAPPSVAGWAGGEAWISSTTMLARTNFALALMSPDDRSLGRRVNLAELSRRGAQAAGSTGTSFLVDLLVQDGIDGRLRGDIQGRTNPVEAATMLLTSAEYQLA